MEKAAKEICAQLRTAGHEALFAGGCVRDQLLGREQKDIDIATNATPDQVLAVFPKGDTIGAHFGVILIRAAGVHFEIATFREDGEYSDGRRPDSVKFTTAENDAKRRDFTVNGMFLEPESGEIIDYVGGKADLESKTLRAIGNPADRFEEDFLRMMRAIRFATVLDNFSIESETWAALQANAHHISEISPERIQAELNKVWTSPNRVRGFDLLVDSGLMRAILPEILELQGCEQPPNFHPEGDVFTHTRIMLGLLKSDASLPLVLSVLFHDVGKPATFSLDPAEGRIRFNSHDKVGADMTVKILKRLRYSNDVIDAAVDGVAHHMQFMNVQKMKTAKLKRFMARPHFDDKLELHRVDCTSSNGFLENYKFIKAKREEFASEPLLPTPFVNGQDLIERGWESGPKMGEKLREIYDLQLEGQVTTREEGLAQLAST
ncbi:MAG: CCA tRNA nucleotidyltransferase [Verrucomicrobiales bacterium]